MNIKLFDDYESLSKQIADEIIADLKQHPKQLLCIAAGHTSLSVFKYLVDAFVSGEADFSDAAFVAMDEWLNMSYTTPESCGSFLLKNFLDHVNYRPENVRLWDGTVKDLSAECTQVLEFIEKHGGSIDYLVLGVGMNGHLALNEPGVSFDASAHVCQLDAVTQNVGQKYFSEQTALTGGITLGISDFKKAKRSVLAINGTKKADILKEILQSNTPTNTLPATALYTFENAAIYCDKESAIKSQAYFTNN